MVERDTLKARSRAAAMFNAWLTSPGKFGDEQEHYLSLFDQDAAVALAAGPDESAALTIHRMESIGAPRVILATSWAPDHLFVGNFSVSHGRVVGECHDVRGNLTVKEWAENMLVGVAYSANGSEFASVIDSCSPVMADA